MKKQVTATLTIEEVNDIISAVSNPVDRYRGYIHEIEILEEDGIIDSSDAEERKSYWEAEIQRCEALIGKLKTLRGW